MKCQVCGEAEAIIHVKEVKNEKVSELHLCEKCAREKGLHSMVEKGKLSLAGQLVWMAENLYPEGSARIGALQCSECGLRYSEFMKTGRLGCPTCYQDFGEQLRQILRRVHGAVRHSGKAPGQEGALFERRREIQQLHEHLERAIEREDYETAARLRDEIRGLEAGGPDAQERAGAGRTRRSRGRSQESDE
jgi:protein arginine kinase activator